MLKKISLLAGIILTPSLILFLSYTKKFECLFKKWFNICCPGCGLTRSFMALIHFNIKESLHYNILTIPLLIFIIYVCFLIIRDIITKKEQLKDEIYHFLKKYQIIIIIIILITMLINNIHKI